MDARRSPSALTEATSTKALLLLGAPVTIRDLKQRTNVPGDVPQLRADIQAWISDALAQHRTFHDTFLFGCSAHPTTITTQTTTAHIALEQPGAQIATGEFSPMRMYDADGTIVDISVCTTLTSATVTTTVTQTRTRNPHLPMLAGCTELRHARAIGPAVAAIDWSAHDEA